MVMHLGLYTVSLTPSLSRLGEGVSLGKDSSSAASTSISTDSLKTMITEHDTVVLTKALPAPGLEEGDIGAVVHVYEGQKALEVEFVTASGSTVAVETLALDDVRAPRREEILHVRSLAA